MVIKLSMYVGLHDVYPAINVNFAFCREVKVTTACNIFGRKKCVNYKIKIGKERKKKRRKEKRKITDHMIGQIWREIYRRVVSQCFLAKLNES